MLSFIVVCSGPCDQLFHICCLYILNKIYYHICRFAFPCSPAAKCTILIRLKPFIFNRAPSIHMVNVLPGDYQHNWSSFIWEIIRAFMGHKGVIKVRFYCQLLNFNVCLRNCYCCVLCNTTRELPVSILFL